MFTRVQIASTYPLFVHSLKRKWRPVSEQCTRLNRPQILAWTRGNGTKKTLVGVYDADEDLAVEEANAAKGWTREIGMKETLVSAYYSGEYIVEEDTNAKRHVSS